MGCATWPGCAGFYESFWPTLGVLSYLLVE